MKNIFPKIKKILNTDIGVISAYVLLALFFTFPLVLNITDSMATGRNSVDNDYTINSDSIYFMWNMWLTKHNILDMKVNLFSQSDMVFYPNGYNIGATGYESLFNSILSLPLQLVSGNLVLTYNLLVIFNFVFAAYSAYLLARYLTGDKKISVLSGVIFGFSPYMLARSLMHINLLTTGAIPLFILFFLKMLKEPGSKNSLFAAIAFFLLAISAWQYGLFTSLFIAVSLLFFLIYRRQEILNAAYLKRFFLFALLAALLVMPAAFPIMLAYLNHQTVPPAFSDATTYSSDPLSYFIPSPLSNFLGALLKDPERYKLFSNYLTESTAYLGLLEITMLFFCVKYRKKIMPEANYWLFLIIVFFVLSLGPFLKIGGFVLYKIPLPYYFVFKYLPFFNLARESARLSIFVMLFTAIISALSLKFILSKNISSPRREKIIFTAISLIIVAERVIFPYPVEKIKIPPFYKNISAEKENYAIMDLPTDFFLIFSLYNLYQTEHGGKITSGKIMPNAFTPEVYSYIENNDFLVRSTCITQLNIDKKAALGGKTDKKALLNEFKNANIKYIIIHKDIIDYLDGKANPSNKKIFDCRLLAKDIEWLFGGANPVYEDELIKAYKI